MPSEAPSKLLSHRNDMTTKRILTELNELSRGIIEIRIAEHCISFYSVKYGDVDVAEGDKALSNAEVARLIRQGLKNYRFGRVMIYANNGLIRVEYIKHTLVKQDELLKIGISRKREVNNK